MDRTSGGDVCSSVKWLIAFLSEVLSPVVLSTNRILFCCSPVQER